MITHVSVAKFGSPHAYMCEVWTCSGGRSMAGTLLVHEGGASPQGNNLEHMHFGSKQERL